MRHISQIKISAALLFHTLFFVATPAFAADTLFEAGFFLNTESEDINAIEGKIVFPEKILELKEIRAGNSIIDFWIEQPKASNGEILFSGIIPGGYLGKKGLIFSAVFQSMQEGRDSIGIRDIKTLLNDGKGTEANATIFNLQSTALEKKDIDIPEAFKPIVMSDPAMFDGKYFLVFATQDKESGIDHYEVREGEEPFIITESPHILQNQNLDQKIFVKAVDKSGNERVEIIYPRQI